MARDVSITLDFSDMKKHIPLLEKAMLQAERKGLREISDEILRLSQFEVPLDTGMLQNSGHVEASNPDIVLVGYNKPYGARLHEHPEYNFQNGRKGKYLEDPIKNNLATFINFFKDSIMAVMK